MQNSNNIIRILQFTDLHFFANNSGRLLGVDTEESFTEVYHLACEQHDLPNFYLFTGDLSQDETKESYERLASILRNVSVPAYFLPGNHDRRGHMTEGLFINGSPFKPEKHIILENWQIILLDSLQEGCVGGFLCEEELDFVSIKLEESPHLHTLICLHHHPVNMGSIWLDNIGVQNSDKLLAIADSSPSVKAILWGHVHQEFEAERSHYKLFATPSTCVQFKPSSEKFAVDNRAPGYRYLELYADGSIRTSVHRADEVCSGLDTMSLGY